jgi:hypothetical protein
MNPMDEEKLYTGKQYGNEFLSNHRKVIISSRISTTSPFIIFPILALIFHNWWLLLGIPFSHLGGLLSIRVIWLIIAFTFTFIYLIINRFMLNSYVSIFFLCYAYGHLTFTLGRYFEKKFERTKLNMKNDIYSHVDRMRKEQNSSNS